MKLTTRAYILLPILLLMIMPSILSAQQDSTLFLEAKTLMFQKKYSEALNLYEMLKMRYPDSKYSDASEFWSAYILEKQGKTTFAFNAYGDLVQKYPGSTWVDDAMVRQIGLAEKFVREGQQNYQDFLNEKLDSPFKNVRYQAALSLGKFRDQRAVPVLNEMSKNGDRDMKSIANSMLRNYPSQPPGKQLQQERKLHDPSKSRLNGKDDAIKKPAPQPRKDVQKEQRLREPAPPKIDRTQPPKQTSPKSTPPPKSSTPQKKERMN